MENLKSVKVKQVIEAVVSRGNGTKENPNRFVHQYWNFEGKLLAESDPEKEKE